MTLFDELSNELTRAGARAKARREFVTNAVRGVRGGSWPKNPSGPYNDVEFGTASDGAGSILAVLLDLEDHGVVHPGEAWGYVRRWLGLVRSSNAAGMDGLFAELVSRARAHGDEKRAAREAEYEAKRRAARAVA